MECNVNLNETQKSLLDAYLIGDFGALSLLKDDVDPRVSLVAFKALRDLCEGSSELYEQNLNLFESRNILPLVDQITEIIHHPAPQNIREDYPYFGPHGEDPAKWVVFRNEQGKPEFELRGLLTLSSYNQGNQRVGKEAVIEYIKNALQNEIDRTPNPDLNETQKAILDAFLLGDFGVLTLLKEDIVPHRSLMVFEALRDLCDGSKDLFIKYNKTIEKADILPLVNQIVEIINHPAPQNKREDYPYFGKHKNPDKWVVFKNDQGKPEFELRGLLSLSSYNKENQAVSKDAVIEYIKKALQNEIDDINNTVFGKKTNKTNTGEVFPDETLYYPSFGYVQFSDGSIWNTYSRDSSLAQRINTLPQIILSSPNLQVYDDRIFSSSSQSNNPIVRMEGFPALESVD